jgi:hypothetical protein
MTGTRKVTATLSIAGLAVAAAGAFLFDRGDPESLTREAGRGLLQLGLIGIGGAAVGWFVENSASIRSGIEKMVAFLDSLADEYEQSKSKSRPRLRTTRQATV